MRTYRSVGQGAHRVIVLAELGWRGKMHEAHWHLQSLRECDPRRARLEVGVGVFVWTNPNPTKIIKSSEVSSLGLQSNPVLLGMTLFDAPL